jgi:hypothetical protein
MKAPLYLRRSLLFTFIAIVAASILVQPTPTRAAGVSLPWYCQRGGHITLHKDKDFGGSTLLNGPGINWYTMVSGWNDVISSVCVPPGAYITLYRHSNYGGGSLTIDARGKSDPMFITNLAEYWMWNDAISSFKSGK